MALGEAFRRVLSEYPAAMKEEFAGHAVARFVREGLRDEVLRWLPSKRYSAKASAGQGNWVGAPWLAVFDVLVTESAQQGFYPVVEEILKKTTVDDIKEDALRMMGHCRQHIFVFRHDLKAGQLPNKILNAFIEVENLSVDTHERKEIEYLLLNKYRFVQVKGETAIHHRSLNLWPVKIVIRPGYLELRITIAERHIKTEPPSLAATMQLTTSWICLLRTIEARFPYSLER